jgi:hypothetical protein
LLGNLLDEEEDEEVFSKGEGDANSVDPNDIRQELPSEDDR